MIVTSATKQVESLAVTAAPTQVFEATISDSGDFFDMLASNLYKYQKLAVVREVWSNCVDAHRIVNSQKPIEVFISDSEMVFTDFGPGIPHAEMGKRYLSYGEGTKKNDANQIGGFGLGCKAPYSYTNQFTVESCHGGVKSIYSLMKRSSNGSGKPECRLMVQLPTTESGVTVRIPINAQDAQTFTRLLQQVVYSGDFPTNLNNAKMKTVGMPFDTGVLQVIPYEFPIGHVKEYAIRYANVLYPLPEVTTESPEEYRYLCKKLEEFNSILYRHNAFNNERLLIVIQAEPDSLILQPSREAIAETDTSYVSLIKLLRSSLEDGVTEYMRGHKYGIQVRYAEAKKAFVEGNDYNLFAAPFDIKAMSLFKLGKLLGYSDSIPQSKYVALLKNAVYGYAPNSPYEYQLKKWMIEDLKRYCLTPPFKYSVGLAKYCGIHKTIHGNRLRIYTIAMQLQRVYAKLLASPVYTDNKQGTFYFVRNYGNTSKAETVLRQLSYMTNPTGYLEFKERICYVSKGIRDIRDRLIAHGPLDTNCVVFYTKQKFEKVEEQLLPYFDKVVDITGVLAKTRSDSVAAPRSPKLKGLPSFSSAWAHNTYTNKKRLYHDAVDRIDEPVCWITYADFVKCADNPALAQQITKHWGNSIGIVASAAQASTYIKKGVPNFFEYAAKIIEAEFNLVKPKLIKAASRSIEAFDNISDKACDFRKRLVVLNQYEPKVFIPIELTGYSIFSYAWLACNSQMQRKATLLYKVEKELNSILNNTPPCLLLRKSAEALQADYNSHITNWTTLNKNGSYYLDASDDVRKKLAAHAEFIISSLRKHK